MNGRVSVYINKCRFFLKRLSDFLAANWERPYSVVSGWVRARLSFAILRAALLQYSPTTTSHYHALSRLSTRAPRKELLCATA